MNATDLTEGVPRIEIVKRCVKNFVNTSVISNFDKGRLELFVIAFIPLFERAFVINSESSIKLSRRSGDGKYYSDVTVRPSASEWYHTLDRFSKELKVCSVNPQHQYGKHLNKCPWCSLK